MKLSGRLEADALAALGVDAVGMLCRGDVGALARQYGYALSYNRDTATAIRDDLRHCLFQVGATSLAAVSANPVRSVQHFAPDAAPLVAVVECLAPTDNGALLLVELVVTSKGGDTHIKLEQISTVATD